MYIIIYKKKDEIIKQTFRQKDRMEIVWKEIINDCNKTSTDLELIYACEYFDDYTNLIYNIQEKKYIFK